MKRLGALKGLMRTEGFSESGLAGFDVTAWHRLIAPPGTPPGIAERLKAAAALREPAIVDGLRSLGFTPSVGTAVAFVAHMSKESSNWGQGTKSAGIKAD